MAKGVGAVKARGSKLDCDTEKATSEEPDLIWIEWFGHDIDDAGVAASLGFGRLALVHEENDVDAAPSGHRAQSVAELVAAHGRHGGVDEGEVREVVAANLDGFVGRSGQQELDIQVLEGVERVFEERSHVALVIDHQNALLHVRESPRTSG